MTNRLIYDCEIVNAIPTGDRIEGINYCKGWTDFEGMGVSVIGFKQNQDEAEHCLAVGTFAFVSDYRCKGYRIVGFNSKVFDDKLLAANDFSLDTHYDLLEEIRLAAGFDRHWQSVPRGYSYKLDAIAKANGKAKTGSGELAPILWQQGRHQEVIDYCKTDVELTSWILDLGLAGELIDPNTGNKLQLAPI